MLSTISDVKLNTLYKITWSQGSNSSNWGKKQNIMSYMSRLFGHPVYRCPLFHAGDVIQVLVICTKLSHVMNT